MTVLRRMMCATLLLGCVCASPLSANRVVRKRRSRQEQQTFWTYRNIALATAATAVGCYLIYWFYRGGEAPGASGLRRVVPQRVQDWFAHNGNGGPEDNGNGGPEEEDIENPNSGGSSGPNNPNPNNPDGSNNPNDPNNPRNSGNGGGTEEVTIEEQDDDPNNPSNNGNGPTTKTNPTSLLRNHQ